MVNQIAEYPLNRIVHNNENKLQLNATWMEFINTVLSKGIQKQRTIYILFHFYMCQKQAKLIYRDGN